MSDDYAEGEAEIRHFIEIASNEKYKKIQEKILACFLESKAKAQGRHYNPNAHQQLLTEMGVKDEHFDKKTDEYFGAPPVSEPEKEEEPWF